MEIEVDSSNIDYTSSLGIPRNGRVWRPIIHGDSSIALVLSGGGARGMAQVGVIEVLEENGIRPGLIVGVSIGAIVGGLYAAGYSPMEIETFIREIEWSELIYDSPKRTRLFQTQRMATEKFILHLRMSDFKLYIPGGISAAQIISNTLVKYCTLPNYSADGDFDRLPIPFRAVTTDLRSGKPHIFKGGNLAVALRASSAIPLFLAPFETDSSLLADGGLIYPIPVEIAMACCSSLIIAVDATADVVYSGDLNNALLILDQTTNIMAENRKKVERELADVLIRPNLEGYGSYDFSHFDEIVELGREAAREALPKIEALLKVPTDLDYPKYIVATVEGSDPVDLATGDLASIEQVESKIDELYLRGTFASVGARMRIFKDSIYIDVIAKENPPLVAVKASGMSAMSSDSIAGFFEIDSTLPVDFRTVDSTLSFIEELYHSMNYSLAHVTFASFEAGTLGFIFDEGIVERIDIRGNKRTREWLIRSFTSLTYSRRFDKMELEKTLENLHATNLFESVTPRLSRGDSGVVFTIDVVEKPYLGLSLGTRFDLVNGVEGAFEVGDDNLLGIACRLNIGASGGERRWNVYSTIESDRIWRTYLTSCATVFANGTEYNVWDADSITETYAINRYGIQLSIGQQIKRLGTLFFELGTENVAFGPQGENLKEYPLNRFTLRSIVDTFDDRQFPNFGKYHDGYLTISKDILGGEYSFAKSFISLQSYWTWIEPLTFKPYVMGGYMSGGPPFFEQFEIGEEIPFWGMRGDERRGNSLFKSGFEIRLNPMEPVYIFGGLSCGRTWQRDSNLALENMIWGWGAGWGVATPLGPVLLSWGRNTEKLESVSFFFGYDF
jgi:NTE family protein